MQHRYFLIEPLYKDPDVFCNFTVGSGRIRANIQIYADEDMLADVARALVAPDLSEEASWLEPTDPHAFDLRVSVAPRDDGFRTVRFQVFQAYLDDGCPFSADVRFRVSPSDAKEFSEDLSRWLEQRDYRLEWKLD